MLIYKTTNLITGKVYIGQTVLNRPSYLGSGVYIKRAIKKYKRENFVRENIDTAETQEELNIKEKFWAEYYNSYVPLGYNVRECGGSRGNHSKETIAKMSKSKRGVKFSAEHIENLSKAHKGIPCSDNAKLLVSEFQKGRVRSEETRKKMSDSVKGRKHTEESKLKMSIAKKGNKSSLGRIVSDESREKMSAAKRGKKYSESHKLSMSLAQLKRAKNEKSKKYRN